MAGPFDNAQGPPSSAQWMNGNMAQQLYQMIGGLPQDYFQGTQNKRTLDLQKPILGPDGQPSTDMAGILQELLKRGGGQTAQELLPTLQKQPIFQELLRRAQRPENGGADDQPQAPTQQQPNVGPSASVHSGPASIMGPQGGQQASTSAQPQTSASGGDESHGGQTPGGDTINSIAAEGHVDLDAFLRKYPGARRLMDMELSPGQVAGLKQRMAEFKTSGQGSVAPVESRDTTSTAGFGGQPQRTENTGELPVGGAGGAPISPRPTSAPAAGGATGMVPPAWRGKEQAYADVLKRRAAGIRTEGDLRGIVGIPSKAKEDQAAALDKQADAILEQLGKAGELTGEQKNVASGATERGEQTKADIKYYDTLHRGLAGSGMIAAQQKQNVDILRQVAAAPSFTPGTGTDLWRTYQRAMAQFGINPTGAAPREIFDQVAARILADQFSGIKSLAAETGEQGARIFKSMLDIEEKANITPEDSLEGIKAKLDVIDKTGDLMMKWADKADDYKLKHGRLDAGFDKELRADIAKARVQNAVPKAAPAQAGGGPPVGHIQDGYRFKGGNPRDPKSWEAVRAAGERS